MTHSASQLIGLLGLDGLYSTTEMLETLIKKLNNAKTPTLRSGSFNVFSHRIKFDKKPFPDYNNIR